MTAIVFAAVLASCDGVGVQVFVAPRSGCSRGGCSSAYSVPSRRFVEERVIQRETVCYDVPVFVERFASCAPRSFSSFSAVDSFDYGCSRGRSGGGDCSFGRGKRGRDRGEARVEIFGRGRAKVRVR